MELGDGIPGGESVTNENRAPHMAAPELNITKLLRAPFTWAVI